MKCRILTLFLMVMTVATMLAGCGSEQPTPNNPASTPNSAWFGQTGNDTIGAAQPSAGQPTSPITVTSGKDIFADLALDSTNIYFIAPVELDKDNFPVMGIYKVPKNGEKASPEVLLKGIFRGSAGVTELIGDEDSLYFDMENDSKMDLVRLEKKNGNLTTLYSVNASDSNKVPAKLAQDADNIYWLSRYEVEVGKVSKKGGNSTFLVPAFQGTSQSGGLFRRALLVDNSSVYYMSGEKLTLEKVEKNGGTPTVLLKFDKEQSMPTNIAWDGNSFYWLGVAPSNNDFSKGGIVKLPKSGGNPSAITVKASDQLEFDPLNFDNQDLFLFGNNFYWSARSFKVVNKREIRRVSLNGGPYASLAILDSGPNLRFAEDEKNIYWVSGTQTFKLAGGNLILRTPK